MAGDLALGSEAFAQRLRGEARGNPREQASLRSAPEASAWPRILSALERAKGESWNSFAERHGDWGRDAALWLGRRTARFPVAELGKLAGALDYAVVSKALARFGRRLEADPRLHGASNATARKYRCGPVALLGKAIEELSACAKPGCSSVNGWLRSGVD